MVLDLCCGTGDLAFSLARASKARIVGKGDFSHSMLTRAKEKSDFASGKGWKVPFFEADALRLPFADASFDLVTTAFGFRNLANYKSGLREILRVLKRGGTIGILEFTEPAPGLLGNGYRFYTQRLCDGLAEPFREMQRLTRIFRSQWRDFSGQTSWQD